MAESVTTLKRGGEILFTSFLDCENRNSACKTVPSFAMAKINDEPNNDCRGWGGLKHQDSVRCVKPDW